MLKFNDINIHEANGVALRIRLGVVLGLRLELRVEADVLAGLGRVAAMCARSLCAPRSFIVPY